MNIKRGIKDVCVEAREMLRDKYESDEELTPGEVIGYFDEIINILNEQSEDLGQEEIMAKIIIYLTEEDLYKLKSGERVDVSLNRNVDNVTAVTIIKEKGAV